MNEELRQKLEELANESPDEDKLHESCADIVNSVIEEYFNREKQKASSFYDISPEDLPTLQPLQKKSTSSPPKVQSDDHQEIVRNAMSLSYSASSDNNISMEGLNLVTAIYTFRVLNIFFLQPQFSDSNVECSSSHKEREVVTQLCLLILHFYFKKAESISNDNDSIGSIMLVELQERSAAVRVCVVTDDIQERNRLQEEMEKYPMCLTCFEPVTPDLECIAPPPCSHIICGPCLTSYAEELINSNKV